MSPSSSVLAAVTVLAATTVAAGPARAASYTHHDPPKDVVSLDSDGTGPQHPAPGVQSIDVVSITTTFTDRQLRLTVRFRGPSADSRVRWDIGTATRRFRLFYDGGLMELYRGQTPVPCAETSQRLARDGLVIRVPDSCLGATGYVRTGMIATGNTADAGRIVQDDAQRLGAPHRSPALGPHVDRG